MIATCRSVGPWIFLYFSFPTRRTRWRGNTFAELGYRTIFARQVVSVWPAGRRGLPWPFCSEQRLALRKKLQHGADHPACDAGCARFRLRVLQAKTVRQSGHGPSKVDRVHGKRNRVGFEEAFEDSRQGAGLLVLQSVIAFREDGISARVEL